MSAAYHPIIQKAIIVWQWIRFFEGGFLQLLRFIVCMQMQKIWTLQQIAMLRYSLMLSMSCYLVLVTMGILPRYFPRVRLYVRISV